MVNIDQNRRGGGMAVAWSFNSYQIVISSNTDCVSELWAERKTSPTKDNMVKGTKEVTKTKKGLQSDF